MFRPLCSLTRRRSRPECRIAAVTRARARWRWPASDALLGLAGGLREHFSRGAQQVLEPERLGQPAAAGLFEELLRFGAGHVAGDEDDAPRSVGSIALERAIERHPVNARHFQIADDQVVDSRGD